MARRIYIATVAFIAVLLPTFSFAQEDLETSDELPSAEEVLERYAEEVGGVMALSGIESARVSMTLDYGNGPGPATGGDSSLSLVWLSEIGWTSTSDQGVVSRTGNWQGKVWRTIDGANAKWLEGEEARQSATMMPTFVPAHANDWLEKADDAEVIGKETLEETEVYAVELELEDDLKQKVFFDVENGLLFAMEFKQAGMESVMYVKDYREVEGFLIPHEYDYRIVEPEIKMSVKVKEIEFDGDLDVSDLEVPEKLMDESQSSDDK